MISRVSRISAADSAKRRHPGNETTPWRRWSRFSGIYAKKFPEGERGESICSSPFLSFLSLSMHARAIKREREREIASYGVYDNEEEEPFCHGRV